MATIDPHLEKNYNMQASRDGLADVMQRWTLRSEQIRKNADVTLDCQYGEGDRDRIDVFRCGEADAPLYVYLHGGYWQRGDKYLYSVIAAPFLDAKTDVAIVGYPLCPQVSMTVLVDKIRQAVLWLYRNATRLGINGERINLSGHSAGGHLTAMGICTNWPAFEAELPKDLLKTGIPFSGLYELEPLLHTTISEALHLSENEVQVLSPALLRPTGNAPLLMVLGGAETAEFFRQTDNLIEQWSSFERIIDRHIEPDADHFDLVDRLANGDSEVFKRIITWLE